MQDEFREFYKRNFSGVFAYFYGQGNSVTTALELTALTFERASEEWKSRRGPPLRRPFLFALARAVRQEKAANGRPTESRGEIIATEKLSDLSAFFARLDPEDRELMSLRFDAGLDYGEIAEVVGLTRAEISRRMLGAVRKLTALMSQP